MPTLTLSPEHLTELQELVTEKTEQIENLVQHYENSLEALASAGTDGATQRLNYEAALNENKNRLQLFLNLKNNLAV